MWPTLVASLQACFEWEGGVGKLGIDDEIAGAKVCRERRRAVGASDSQKGSLLPLWLVDCMIDELLHVIGAIVIRMLYY